MVRSPRLAVIQGAPLNRTGRERHAVSDAVPSGFSSWAGPAVTGTWQGRCWQCFTGERCRPLVISRLDYHREKRHKPVERRSAMARVRFEDTAQGLDAAVAAIFNAFGGDLLLKSSRDVYIKVNALTSSPMSTPPGGDGGRGQIFQGARRPARLRHGEQHPGQLHAARLRDHGMRNMCEETGAIRSTSTRPPRFLYLQKLQSFISIPDFIHDHSSAGDRKPLHLGAQAQEPLHDNSDPGYQEPVRARPPDEPHT